MVVCGAWFCPSLHSPNPQGAGCFFSRMAGVQAYTGGYAPGWPTVAASACVPSVLGVCRVWRTGVWRVGA